MKACERGTQVYEWGTGLDLGAWPPRMTLCRVPTPGFKEDIFSAWYRGDGLQITS